jgi:CHAT domain-containing protein
MITQSEIARLTGRAAVERFVKSRYQGDDEKFVLEVNSSLNQLLQTDLKKAVKFLRAVRTCFAFLPKRFAPRLLAAEARVAHWTGKSKDAVGKYRSAIRQFDRNKEFQLTAQTRMGLMDAYMYLGQHQEALDTGKKALQYFLKNRQNASAARVMTNIGNVYHRLDRNPSALRYYAKAREIFLEKGGVPLAIVDFNRANIYANLNRLDEAEKIYLAAGETYRQNGMTLAAAKVDYSLAYLYFLRDEYSPALAKFDQALGAFRSLGDAKAVAVTSLDLAEINIYLNQLGSTVMFGQEAIDDFKRLGMRYEEAKAAYFMASALRHFGDHNQAFKHLAKAEKLFAGEGNDLWLGMVGLERAQMELDSGEAKLAAKSAASAQKLFRKSGDKRRTLDAEIATLAAGMAAGSATAPLNQAQKLARQPLSNHQEYSLHLMTAQFLRKQSKPRQALQHLRKAMSAVERVVPNLPTFESRYFYTLGRSASYSEAVECLLQLGKPRESFLQNSRALTVLNQRSMPTAKQTAMIPPQLLKERDALRASLKKLARFPDSGDIRTTSAPALRRLEHKLYGYQREINQLLAPQQGPGGVPLSGVEFRYDQIATRDLILNPVVIGEDIGVFCATSGGAEFVRCPVKFEMLEAAVRELHFLMENALYLPNGGSFEPINDLLRRLYDWLLEPLGQLPTGMQPIFLVDGLFAQIPYAALTDANGRRCKNRFALKVIVNPEDILTGAGHSEFDATRRSAVFAPASTGLPMVELEGKRIGAAFPNAGLYTEDRATSKNLLAELRDCEGFVHIATHAARTSENPMFSRIHMSDGPFFPFDLFSGGIRAQLVTLSGCQTAAPGIYYANSFSLAKAFYQAGARYVLASLWPVSDKLSMVFMTEFYGSLKNNASIAAAYGAALDKVSALSDNPALWAPYVLLGI